MRLFKELFFFGLVGVLGFIVDTAVLYALKGALGPYYARAISFVVAVFATWLANRTLTFKAKKSDMKKHAEFAVYFGLMLFGGAANYGAYAWLLLHNDWVLQNPIVGVAAGSLAGMSINFMTSRFIVFRKHKHA